MNFWSFSVLFFASGVLLTGILAFVRQRNALARHFLIFSVNVSGWGFIFPFWISQNYSYETTLFLVKLGYIFVVFIPTTWIHFVFKFCNAREPFKYFFLLSYLLSFALLMSLSSPYFFLGMHNIMGFKYIPSPGPIHHLHILMYVTYAAWGIWCLILEARRTVGERQKQVGLFLVGLLFGWLPGSSIYLAFYGIAVPYYILVGVLIYPILTGIAMIKFNLFDPRQIIDLMRRDKLAAIGVLATSINHEIKNPLYIIEGSATSFLENVKQNLYEDKDQKLEESQKILTKVVEQAQRAREIMKNFTAFAKREVAENIEISTVTLSHVINEIKPLLDNELKLDGILLDLVIQHDADRIQSNQRYLEEIFFNLSVNACQAIKHSGKGGHLWIRAKRNNDFVTVEIQDDGPGLTKGQINQIFKPFYTTKEEGTGLGLYITRQLVEKSGGFISVDSKPGVGTTFSLEFKT